VPERAEDGALGGGGERALRDAPVPGGEGDQVHSVQFVTDVAPGVTGAGFHDVNEQQSQHSWMWARPKRALQGAPAAFDLGQLLVEVLASYSNSATPGKTTDR
jgi:hypothetical protein